MSAPEPLGYVDGGAVDGVFGGAETLEEPTLFYGSVDEFVRLKLRFQYRRSAGKRSGERHWVSNWWDYPEAVSRLEAIWRAWESLRHDPALGMSVWWRDHCDYQMRAILDPDGPFAGAGNDLATVAPGEPLPVDTAPEGWFPDMRLQ